MVWQLFSVHRPEARSRTRKARSRKSAGFCLERLEERAVLAVMVPMFSHPHPGSGTMTPAATSGPTGFMAAAMRTAYGMDAIKYGSVSGDGTGQIIAIVDAYDWPSMTTDMTTFNTKMSLPSCTLIKVNQTGQTTSLPTADTKGGWGVETAMDMEWAHAMAPKATLLLVEANSANDADLYTAVDTARNWPGVSAVSMSWGGDETSSDSSTDYHFTTPTSHTGVTFFSSSGDAGKYGSSASSVIVGYPAASPNVVAVGGTNLVTGTNNAWSSETGWGNGTTSYTNGGSGGGVSKYAAQPAYQKGVIPTSMSGSSSPKRTLPDIAADADPNTGASVCSSYDYTTAAPWDVIGGTSLSSPMWAGMMAVFNQGRVANGLSSMDGKTEFLPKLYTLPAADFHDVTSGNNGFAAAAGYDMVTGRGTPIGPKIAADLAGTPATPTPSIGSFAVSPVSVVAGSNFTLSASNVVETGGTISSVKFYRESNGTAGLQIGVDTLVGTGVQSGTTWTLTVSSTGLAAGSCTFYAVATDASAVSTAASTAVLTVTTPITTAAPTVTIASASVTEGSFGTKSLSFVVSLSAAAQSATTVSYATANGTATAGSDYYAASGTATFRAGQRTTTIVVTVKGDTTPEANETFFVTLSNPVNCTLGTSVVATGTILNDDGGALFTPKFSSNNTAIAAAIAKVPTSVGALTSVSIVDFGTTIYTGSIDVTNTLNRIRAGGKSVDTNDGSVYSNSNGAMTPRTGTWFEFVVDPKTGTNHSFSGVTFPGPMRLLLNTDGSTYFTGNHYSTFVSLWKPGTAPVPSVGSLTVSPSSVVAGGSFTLSANNVTEVGGSVTGVKFYRDTNGTTGLQVGSDTLVGTGTQSGGTWTLATTTGSLASGSYTYYAVASDAANVSSAAVSAVLTVTNPLKPVIGSFTVSPASVTVGGSVTLTASNVTETGGSVSSVTFYRETSGTAGLQVGSDAVVGTGTRSGTTWTLSSTTAGFAAGSYTYYAVATDPLNATSLVSAAVLAVTSPSTSTTPSVSISSASLLEGNSGSRALSFLVSLTAPAAVTTTVSFRTSDITATAGSDYQSVTSGTVTFRVGQRTASIVIQVFGDTAIEADETFQIELYNPLNATLGIATAVGTILNDDVVSATPATRRPSAPASMTRALARA